MKAVALNEERKIELQNHPVPEPGPGKVLLRSHFCGICGTDLHAPDLDIFRPPVIMGHEFSAEVAAVGADVTGWSVGMRVVVNPNGNVCRTCSQCHAGRYNLCRTATLVEGLGVCRDGGMAEYVVVPAVHLHALPDSVDSLRGAWTEPLAVAVRAVGHSGIRLGDDVAVIGGGPIGLLVTQLARRAGARRIVLIEPSKARRSVAARLGADVTYDPAEHTAAVADGEFELVDRVFECSGHPSALQAAVDMINPGGSVQIVAISPRPLTFDAMSAIAKEVQFSARFIYVGEFEQAIDLLDRDQVDVVALTTTVVELDEYDSAFAALSSPDTTIKALIRTGHSA
ncbi:zinc-binding dehydrogenase [Amycolatopsis japonica]|uniref:zinc-dependent alcohol dehydrogenase n=1 Tax=Amycolatopsis japonica TaxID=208439 RepID=UPI0036728589